MAKTLILILGDQLTPKIASLQGADPSDCVILMAEVMAEAGYADGFTARMLSSAQYSFHQNTAIAVQSELAKIGIKVNLRAQTRNLYFAKILRKSPYAKGLSFELVEELAQASSSPNQKDRQEFLELVRLAKKLAKG